VRKVHRSDAGILRCKTYVQSSCIPKVLGGVGRRNDEQKSNGIPQRDKNKNQNSGRPTSGVLTKSSLRTHTFHSD